MSRVSAVSGSAACIRRHATTYEDSELKLMGGPMCDENSSYEEHHLYRCVLKLLRRRYLNSSYKVRGLKMDAHGPDSRSWYSSTHPDLCAS